MAGGRRADLAEVLDVLERERIAGQVEHRIEEHRRVAGAEDEAVAVGPVGVRGVVLHHARVEQVSERREAHRGPWMTRIGLLDGVDRERPNRVDAELVERARIRCRGHQSLSVAVAPEVTPSPDSNSRTASNPAPTTPASAPAFAREIWTRSATA